MAQASSLVDQYLFYQLCFCSKPWLNTGTRNTQRENGSQKIEKLDINMQKYESGPWSHIIWYQHLIKNGLKIYVQDLKLENSRKKAKEVPELALMMTKG